MGEQLVTLRRSACLYGNGLVLAGVAVGKGPLYEAD